MFGMLTNKNPRNTQTMDLHSTTWTFFFKCTHFVNTCDCTQMVSDGVRQKDLGRCNCRNSQHRCALETDVYTSFSFLQVSSGKPLVTCHSQRTKKEQYTMHFRNVWFVQSCILSQSVIAYDLLLMFNLGYFDLTVNQTDTQEHNRALLYF